MSSDALRWLFTLSSKVSINRRTRGGGGWAIALHTLRVFKRDKQADGETEKFVSVAIDYCLSFGFILFWNPIDTTAVSQRDNHHALVLCSKEPLYHIGKCYLCVILPNLTQMTQRELLEPESSQCTGESLTPGCQASLSVHFALPGCLFVKLLSGSTHSSHCQDKRCL